LQTNGWSVEQPVQNQLQQWLKLRIDQYFLSILISNHLSITEGLDGLRMLPVKYMVSRVGSQGIAASLAAAQQV